MKSLINKFFDAFGKKHKIYYAYVYDDASALIFDFIPEIDLDIAERLYEFHNMSNNTHGTFKFKEPLVISVSKEDIFTKLISGEIVKRGNLFLKPISIPDSVERSLWIYKTTFN